MISPAKTPSKILQSKDEICQAFQLGDRRFQLWIARGMPVKLIDGRYIAHYDSIERFFENWLNSTNEE